jgi:D-3-phosphoglycerate dehydrogenase
LILFLTKEELHSKGTLKTDLIELAKSSDIIVVLCNLNKSTQGMINNKFFSNMKKTSYIINLSRGPVINEKDLELALENKMIAGAGLDVTSEEPLSPNSKLMSFENVILTPHSLCWTDECFHNIATEAINSILNFFDGTKLENQVN